jgi:hypothetical protein
MDDSWSTARTTHGMYCTAVWEPEELRPMRFSMEFTAHPTLCWVLPIPLIVPGPYICQAMLSNTQPPCW